MWQARAKRLRSGARARAPYVSLMPAIDRVNAAVNASLSALQREQPGRQLRMVDCGRDFRVPPAERPAQRLGGAERPAAGPEVRDVLMPDGLHPSLEGQRLLAGCLRAAVERWLH